MEKRIATFISSEGIKAQTVNHSVHRIQFIRKIYGIESYVLNVVKRICILVA